MGAGDQLQNGKFYLALPRLLHNIYVALEELKNYFELNTE